MFIPYHCKQFHYLQRPGNVKVVTVLNYAVHCMAGKPEGKRPLGRPRRRWEDNIKMALQEVGGGCGDWMGPRIGTGGGHSWVR